jgi:hypothetical protein
MTGNTKKGRRLRITAVLILILGIATGDAIYLRGIRTAALPDDPSLLGYDKIQTRQVGTLYGQQGVLVQEWSDDLKQPRTQAIIIVVISALLAGGCFYVARLLDSNAQL